MNPEVRRCSLIAAAAVLGALVAPAVAWGHATLVRTEPGNGAVLARPPALVRVVFDDVVRVGPGIAAIRNKGGASILAGKARVEGGRTLLVPLRRGLANGDYSVRWSIISDDGHLESGVLAFAVGLGRAPPLAGLSSRATGPSADSVGSRWLFFAGVLGAAGIAIFTLVVRPRDEERIPLILSTSAVLAAIGAVQEVHRVGLSTRDGAALGAGFMTALVVATAAAAATLDRRALRPALVLALGLAAVPSFGGHALDRGLNHVNLVVDVLHVAGAAAWTGALLGLVLVRDAPRRRTVALAAGGVLVLGATGIVRASFELLHVSQLWSTSYGRTLLVKTGLLLVALALGWLLRARDSRRAGAELLLVACLVAAVSVLVLLRPGRNVLQAAASPAQARGPFPSPPPPPPGAVVVAREAGPFGVAVAAEPRRVTVFVLAPAGGGLSGLDLSIDAARARPCGHGCYRVDAPPWPLVHVTAAGLQADVAVPSRAPSADALVRQIRARYRALRSVTYDERLASDLTHAIDTRWRLERPNRFTYAIAGGPDAVVIGPRRWDRDTPHARWIESAQTPLPQPATQWIYAANAHVLAETRRTITVSFVDPTIPAYFMVTLDRRTLLPCVLHMTASAHFMTDRYAGFNEPPAIRPPR
jgi:copper transport protein